MARKNYWLMKTEPSTYAWEDLVRDGATAWEGVRSFPARLHLRSMHPGDQALIYHSGEQKSVVGVAEVTSEAYADASAEDGDWSVVDIKPLRALKRPVTLSTIKAEQALAAMPLLKQSRLSVSPCTADEFKWIVRLGG
jgi:predicted RNA-binding protein with PUA-like domain